MHNDFAAAVRGVNLRSTICKVMSIVMKELALSHAMHGVRSIDTSFSFGFLTKFLRCSENTILFYCQAFCGKMDWVEILERKKTYQADMSFFF